MKKYSAQIALLAALVVSFVASLFSAHIDDYFLDIILNVGINVTLAVSLNLVNGHTGQFSLGHAGFMAVGAYGASIVSLHAGEALLRIAGGNGPIADGALLLVALLVGGIAAALFGLLVGV